MIKRDSAQVRKIVPRIAVVAPAYLPTRAFGGPVTALFNLVKTFQRNGYPLTVYVADIADPSRPSLVKRLKHREEIGGAAVKRYRAILTLAGYWITPLMFKDLLQDNFDVLHAHCARSFQLDLAALVSFLRRKPLVVTPHGSVYSYGAVGFHSDLRKFLFMIHNAILKLVLARANTIIATSAEEMVQLARFGAYLRKTKMIPNLLDESEFANLPGRGAFRGKFGVNSKEKLILYVGRLSGLKGIDVLIRAFARISRHRSDAWLFLVGPDDGYLDTAHLLIRKLQCFARVRIVGALYGNEKLEAFVDSDLVVVPSRYESFGMTALEALSCGKPVIASYIGGLRELIRDKQTGFFFTSGRADELADILERVLDDGETLEKMGMLGRETVLTRYSAKELERETLGVCDSLVARVESSI